MKNNTQSLAVIPASVEASIKPKPSKAEIIDALTELRVSELIEESRKKVDRRKELDPIITKRLLKLGRVCDLEVKSFGWVSRDTGRVNNARLEIELGSLPADLEALIVEWDKLPGSAASPDERKVRKEVAERVNGSLSRSERVDAILSDPDSNAALRAALAKLYQS